MAARRAIRLRKEYLYRKAQEKKENDRRDQREQLRTAIEHGRAIPTELRKEAQKIRAEMEMEDVRTKTKKSHVDDEYALAGVRDPKVCVTTSRSPSSRLKQFAKELRILFPNSQRINRGGTTTGELVSACKRADFTDIVMVQETRGEPDALVVCHLPYGPTAQFSLSGVVLRHDLGSKKETMSEAYPHVILDGLRSPIGERLGNVLRHLFPVPKPDSKRVVTFANSADYISFRHHTFEKDPSKGAGKEAVTLTEVGPRFEMRPYRVTLGTVEQKTAQVEWVLRPYMNTAAKRRTLG